MNLKKMTHYWYSKKYEAMHRDRHGFYNYALIDGKVIQYSQGTSEKKSPGNWDDMKYLGKGIFSHSGRKF